ncbi:MAG: dehydratase [Elusimicrobia bacterium]|nr:dehydratase [Elusimicrobiota bacterium]
MNSLFFEDYQAGQLLNTGGRTITETDVVAFSCLSGDFNPLHSNVEFAKKGVFGQRIAHGLLGLSVLTGLVHEAGFIRESAVAFTTIAWKFKKPVFLNDTISGTFKVKQTKGIGSQGLVLFEVKIVNQKGETVGEGEWSLMIKKKGA